MKTKWVEKEFKYDGTQLRSLFAYLHYGLLGDSIVAWKGACSISFEHMVDGEDLLQNSIIESDHMIHFIVEKFDISLFAAAALQRVMGSLCVALLKEMSPDNSFVQQLIRKGDDIYADDKKLNISIATQSPTSSLIHFGVNVKNEGTPVPTLCLEECGVDPIQFANKLMDNFASEVESLQKATQKVRWVK